MTLYFCSALRFCFFGLPFCSVLDAADVNAAELLLGADDGIAAGALSVEPHTSHALAESELSKVQAGQETVISCNKKPFSLFHLSNRWYKSSKVTSHRSRRHYYTRNTEFNTEMSIQKPKSKHKSIFATMKVFEQQI